MLQNILQIKRSDKIKLADMFAKTGAKRVGVLAKRLKFNFAEHVIRGRDSKWSRTLTTWVPHVGHRSRGRPAMRWEDEIKTTFGLNWRQKSRDRTTWTGLVDTYAQKWATEDEVAEG